MNDQSMSSAPGASLLPDSTSIITGTHFAFMAIFAMLVILGILWGMRLKRRRQQADKEVAQDNRDISVTDRDPGVVASADDTAPRAPVRAPSATSDTLAATPPLAHDLSSPLPAADGRTGGDTIPVTRLKGLGPKVAARLGELGITDAAQLATLSDDDATKLDAQLGSFSGRMARDRWIEQARFLAAGDEAGFEAVFGKL